MNDTSDRTVEIRHIAFDRRRQARAALLPNGVEPSEALSALSIPPARALILVSGAAASLDTELLPRLRQLFGRGLARAARRTAATVIDGGTDAGVMALVGQALAEQPSSERLLGIAPTSAVTFPGSAAPAADSLVPLEPNHSRFVLVEGQAFGDETPMLFALADALCVGRAVTVVVGGGAGTRDEVLRTVRRGWPVIVVAGTHGFADELAATLAERKSFIADPVLAEIVADGQLHLFQLDAEIDEFELLLVRLLTDAETLRHSWERFSLYDRNAVIARKRFERLQNSILLLGVVGTFLALTEAQWQVTWQSIALPWPPGRQVSDALRTLILLSPITISILAAVVGRTRIATQWVLLRGAAESIKREIFRYRVQAGIYRDLQTAETSREVKLANQVAALSHHVAQTEVNTASLEPYNGPTPPVMDGASGVDDGLSFLTPERYVDIRIADQLSYYRARTRRLGRRIATLQWLILAAGGAGTFLAAVEHELWVAFATAVVTALTAYLQYQQLEYTLVKYNQCEASLANIQRWWAALVPGEQADQRNREKLVEATEQILEAETTGWVQQMHDALAKLDADSKKEA